MKTKNGERPADFDRWLEKGAAAAWTALLADKAREFDLRMVDTGAMEELASLAWDLGATFAEAGPVKFPVDIPEQDAKRAAPAKRPELEPLEQVHLRDDHNARKHRKPRAGCPQCENDAVNRRLKDFLGA